MATGGGVFFRSEPPYVVSYIDKLKQFYLCAFLGEGFGEAGDAAATAFDNVLVHGGVKGDGIVAVVTGHAEGTFRQAGRGHEAILRKVMQ